MLTHKGLICCFGLILLLKSGIYCAGSSDVSQCPPHLLRNQYLRRNGDKCYYFETRELEWNEARSKCRQSGGDLITIPSRDVQIFVEGVLREIWRRNGMWIGAHDRHDEMNWIWVTGQKAYRGRGFENWDHGQPSCFLPNFLCHEDCACLRIDEGYKWHDYLCSSDLYEYGFACEYDVIPTPKPQPPAVTSPIKRLTTTTTTSTTTTTTTTPAPITPAPTTPAPPPKTTAVPSKTSPVIQVQTSKDFSKSTTILDSLIKDTTTLKTTTERPDVEVPVVGNAGQVEASKMEENSDGIKTGSLVALIVSFVLVFIAGLVIGLLFCRRRRNKYEESMVVGFNNVLYEPAPTSPLHGSRVKDTNIILATHRNDDLDTDTESEHRYVDIADLGNGACGLSNVKGAKFVDLPTCKNVDKEAESFSVNCVNQNIYDTVKDSWPEKEDDEEEPSAEFRSRSNDEPEGGVNGAEQEEEEFSAFEGGASEMTDGPPPVPCRHFGGTPFSPEFLKKDTDVSQAYSNNLYGYHK